MIPTKSTKQVLITKWAVNSKIIHTLHCVSDKSLLRALRFLNVTVAIYYVVGMLAVFGLVLQFKKCFIVSDENVL